ncbi:NADH-quinone oxidoreductase subunit NuoG [Paracoccaceae bacterium GXU_MW_L88]
MSDLKKIVIDGQELEVDGAMTILQACEEVGVEIPRFCYHERLSIAGNCRMCLVEVVGGPPKPTASCAMQVKDLRPGKDGEPPVVKTNSPMVKKAREGVMEFLLINHPLDCPICDQGGECDLQDQAIAYGVDFSRYREPKRANIDIDLGPLVETHMTRCISCTRCVRFTTEVAGVTQMGQTGRGEDAEITTYLGETLDSNLQGNIIDLCPVGALVSKPYAFNARPWELVKVESIDVMDGLGSNIRVDSRSGEVMRIVPRNNDGVNEEWLADRSRFLWDGLKRQRLDRPYARKDGKLVAVSWGEALGIAAEKLKGASKVAALAGDLAPTEAIWALKELLPEAAHECRTEGEALPAGDRGGYVGTATIADLDEAEMIQIIGCNPRIEAPVLNARIRKAWLRGADIGYVGPSGDLTYEVANLGSDFSALDKLASQKISDKTREKNTVIVLGASGLAGEGGDAVLAAALRLAENSNSKILVLHQAASRVGAMDVGFTSEGGIDAALDGADVIYNLGVDERDMPEGAFVIYQGTHGDRGAHRADLILPGAAYTEESAIFVNTEGRPQLAQKAGTAPGQAKENWAIIRALSGEMGATLPFDSLPQLRGKMIEAIPHFGDIDMVPVNEPATPGDAALGEGQFRTPRDHYLANPILRASPLMGELARRASERHTQIAAE